MQHHDLPKISRGNICGIEDMTKHTVFVRRIDIDIVANGASVMVGEFGAACCPYRVAILTGDTLLLNVKVVI